MDQITVTSRDGVELAMRQAGHGDIGLVFIHGFNQCHLAWTRQLADPALNAACRMAAFDLRGHGASAKPSRPEAYTDAALWAADVAAVIAATGFRKPILVGWSYAGRVITDYIREHGTSALGGIVFVGALLKADGRMMGRGRRHFAPMLSADLATNIDGTRGFLRACFEREPARDDFETMLAYNMVVPPVVRKHLLDRSGDPADVLGAIGCPVLLAHGGKDQVILAETSRFAVTQIPNAQLSIYDACGHSPFYEDATRFNAELLAFANSVHQATRDAAPT
ncbi:MAG: alpha/beta hydrolase [Xanthobacteraceae bacterium]|nr:MAG: alpha/beta hydrolase [Xanthobacteraceae bacterium]